MKTDLNQINFGINFFMLKEDNVNHQKPVFSVNSGSFYNFFDVLPEHEVYEQSNWSKCGPLSGYPDHKELNLTSQENTSQLIKKNEAIRFYIPTGIEEFSIFFTQSKTENPQHLGEEYNYRISKTGVFQKSIIPGTFRIISYLGILPQYEYTAKNYNSDYLIKPNSNEISWSSKFRPLFEDCINDDKEIIIQDLANGQNSFKSGFVMASRNLRFNTYIYISFDTDIVLSNLSIRFRAESFTKILDEKNVVRRKINPLDGLYEGGHANNVITNEIRQHLEDTNYKEVRPTSLNTNRVQFEGLSEGTPFVKFITSDVSCNISTFKFFTSGEQYNFLSKLPNTFSTPPTTKVSHTGTFSWNNIFTDKTYFNNFVIADKDTTKLSNLFSFTLTDINLNRTSYTQGLCIPSFSNFESYTNVLNHYAGTPNYEKPHYKTLKTKDKKTLQEEIPNFMSSDRFEYFYLNDWDLKIFPPLSSDMKCLKTYEYDSSKNTTDTFALKLDTNIGYLDGKLKQAQFSRITKIIPWGDKQDKQLIIDSGNSSIRLLEEKNGDFEVSEFIKSNGNGIYPKFFNQLSFHRNLGGYRNGQSDVWELNSPTSAAFDGEDLYITDTLNHCIRKVTFKDNKPFEMSLYAGKGPGIGISDTYLDKYFEQIQKEKDKWVFSKGTTYSNNHCGYRNGHRLDSNFFLPYDIVIKNKKMFISDYGNNVIRMIDMETDQVSTVCGGGGQEENDYYSGIIFDETKSINDFFDLLPSLNTKNFPYNYLCDPSHYYYFRDSFSGLNQDISYKSFKNVLTKKISHKSFYKKFDKNERMFGHRDNTFFSGKPFYEKNSNQDYLTKDTIWGYIPSKTLTFNQNLEDKGLLFSPSVMCLDFLGRIWFSDTNNSCVRRYDPRNSELTTILYNIDCNGLVEIEPHLDDDKTNIHKFIGISGIQVEILNQPTGYKDLINHLVALDIDGDIICETPKIEKIYSSETDYPENFFEITQGQGSRFETTYTKSKNLPFRIPLNYYNNYGLTNYYLYQHKMNNTFKHSYDTQNKELVLKIGEFHLFQHSFDFMNSPFLKKTEKEYFFDKFIPSISSFCNNKLWYFDNSRNSIGYFTQIEKAVYEFEQNELFKNKKVTNTDGTQTEETKPRRTSIPRFYLQKDYIFSGSLLKRDTEKYFLNGNNLLSQSESKPSSKKGTLLMSEVFNSEDSCLSIERSIKASGLYFDSGTKKMELNVSPDSSIKSPVFAFTGTLTAPSMVAPSDMRLKNVLSFINTSYNCLDFVNQLTPIKYTYKDVDFIQEAPTDLKENKDNQTAQTAQTAQPDLTKKIHFGLSAQEVKKFIPELISENSEGKMLLNYIEIIPFLIEAIKSLTNEINILKTKT